MTPDERAFTLGKSRQIAEAVAANLGVFRRFGIPYALEASPGSRRGTYVIVGAGPSLADTGPLLAKYQRAGAVICTVNTALKKVAQYVVPDVVLTREVVDVSAHLDYPAKLRVVDVSANPKVVAKARAMGDTAFFISSQLPFFEVASVLGVRPLFGGGGALTAMVQLAEQWGAAQIVLLGVDLALAPDGSGYATGTAFSGYNVSSATGVVSGEGLKVKQEAHASGGVAPPTTQMGLKDVPAWGGKGTVKAMQVYWDQLEWLQNFHARYKDDIYLQDATGAGASKGWKEVTGFTNGEDLLNVGVITRSEWVVVSFFEAPYNRPLVSIPKENWDALYEDLYNQTRRTKDISANILHPEGFMAGLEDVLHGTDLIDFGAARDLLMGFESGLPITQKIYQAYKGAFPEAAERMADIFMKIPTV